MKKFILLLLFFTYSFLSFSQHQIVIQRNGEAVLYEVIDSAFAHLQDNDTLYLPARTFKTNGAGIATDKKVHLIGAGYHKGINDSIPITVIDGILKLYDGADGSTFEGFQLTSYLYLGDDPANADVDNVSFKRCKFNQLINLGSNGDVQYVQFNECVFLSWVDGKNATHLSFNNCFFSSQLRFTKGNTVVDHCIIEGQFNHNDNITISNSILESGGTIGGTNSGYALINCLFMTTDPGPYFQNSPNQVINCFGPDAWTEVYTDCPVDVYTNGYNPHHDYRLKEGSPYKNAGSDGTDIGLYGGSNPFKHNCLPSNPHILSSEIAAETDENGMLNIQITVEAQDN